MNDNELQNFANQLSADGKGSDGGVGMVSFVSFCLLDLLLKIYDKFYVHNL